MAYASRCQIPWVWPLANEKPTGLAVELDQDLALLARAIDMKKPRT
jgi:hypothetical protein